MLIRIIEEDLGAFIENTVKDILGELKKQDNKVKTDNFDCFELPSLLKNKGIFAQGFGEVGRHFQEEEINDKNVIDQAIWFITRKYKTMKDDFEYLVRYFTIIMI